MQRGHVTFIFLAPMDELLDLRRKLERLTKLLFWLPPVVGLIAVFVNVVLSGEPSAASGLLFWFGTVLFLLYRSGRYAQDGMELLHSHEQRQEIMNRHLEHLHPGIWSVIGFLHGVIAVVAVLVVGRFVA